MPATSLTSPREIDRASRLRKGGITRAVIVDTALAIARRDGLEGLTIGAIAEQMSMSKSGVFTHFGSREELQLAVLNEYSRSFVAEVLTPAVRSRRGLPRLQKILERWLILLARELTHGCLMVGGSIEYDDRDGPLHDAMVAIISGWKAELRKAIAQAVEESHLRADVDGAQLVFEIYGLMLALHQDARLLHAADSIKRARTGIARLLEAAMPAKASSKAKPMKLPVSKAMKAAVKTKLSKPAKSERRNSATAARSKT